MGKVSGYIDKRLVFRETFNNEQSVRSNNNVPTNATFVPNAIRLTGTSRINTKFPLIKGSTYSVRIKFSNYVNSWYRYWFAGKNVATTGLFFRDTQTTQVLTFGGATTIAVYVNGVSTTTLPSTSCEIVGVFTPNNSDELVIGAYGNTTANGIFADIELFEIYNGTLSASDAKNLYNGKFTRRANLNDKEELLGEECLKDGNNINDATWGRNVTAWELLNGSARYNASETGRAISQVNVNMAIPLKAYTLYKLSFTISDCNDLAYPYFLTASGGAMYYPYPVQHTISRFPNGNHSIYIYTNDQNAQGLGVYAYTQGSAFTISNLTLKEVLVCKTPSVLEITSPKGSIIEKNGFIFTNTNVTVKKQAELFTSFFTTTSTSKLDLGANELHKDKTYICWIKTVGWNSVIDSRILDNGRSMLRAVGGNPQYRVSNDGGATFGNAYANSATVNTWQLLVVTRFTRGNCPVYVNSQLASTLTISGNVVVPGTTNLFLGNNAVSTRQHYGFIDNFRIVDGILSVDEIAQIYSSERRKYNV